MKQKIITATGYLLSALALIWFTIFDGNGTDKESNLFPSSSVDYSMDQTNPLPAHTDNPTPDSANSNSYSLEEQPSESAPEQMRLKAYEQAKQEYIANNPNRAIVFSRREQQLRKLSRRILTGSSINKMYRPALSRMGMGEWRQDQLIVTEIERREERVRITSDYKTGKISKEEQINLLKNLGSFYDDLSVLERANFSEAQKIINLETQKNKFIKDLGEYSKQLSNETIQRVADTYMAYDSKSQSANSPSDSGENPLSRSLETTTNTKLARIAHTLDMVKSQLSANELEAVTNYLHKLENNAIRAENLMKSMLITRPGESPD